MTNEFTIPQYTLITYLRDKKRNPIGVLVAVKTSNNGEFNIGYAMCRKGDRFCKKMGLKIALGRCEHFDAPYLETMPYNLKKMMPRFMQRCAKYYKKGL